MVAILVVKLGENISLARKSLFSQRLYQSRHQIGSSNPVMLVTRINTTSQCGDGMFTF